MFRQSLMGAKELLIASWRLPRLELLRNFKIQNPKFRKTSKFKLQRKGFPTHE
jgi:hypothetical protein